MSVARRGYLDWLRGIAVLIMIEAHTIESWTRASDREHGPFGYAIILGGFGAPIFLLLAGIAIPLMASARMRKGATQREAAASVRRRGWEIFGLAFLFRLQSFVLSGGAPAQTLLKVDILNIMGLAMVGAAALWGLARSTASRAVLLGSAAVGLTMLTPVVRTMPWLSWLPDPVEWYLRPYPGRTTFTIFPWAGFLFAGAVLGVVLAGLPATAGRPGNVLPAEAGSYGSKGGNGDRRFVVALAVIGPLMALAGYGASYLPPIYAQTNFWTSSPTFFFLRLGVLISLVPLAYGLSRALPRVSALLEYFGRASLFIYWIHVEMVYGVVSVALHKQLTFAQAVAAFAIFSAFLFGVAKTKDYLVARWTERASDEPRRRRSAEQPNILG
jgi:uncharacterized membrane protein